MGKQNVNQLHKYGNKRLYKENQLTYIMYDNIPSQVGSPIHKVLECANRNNTSYKNAIEQATSKKYFHSQPLDGSGYNIVNNLVILEDIEFNDKDGNSRKYFENLWLAIFGHSSSSLDKYRPAMIKIGSKISVPDSKVQEIVNGENVEDDEIKEDEESDETRERYKNNYA